MAFVQRQSETLSGLEMWVGYLVLLPREDATYGKWALYSNSLALGSGVSLAD